MSRIESFPPGALPAAPTALADALGAIRAQMQALKACEAELRRALIAARPTGPIEGAEFIVTLRHDRRRRLDPSRLPAYIRDDPAFYSESRTITPVTTPVTTRAAPAPAAEDDEAFEVIDRFG